MSVIIDPSIQSEVLEILRTTGALQQGHFLLSSGLHSDQYCQCAKLFEHPKYSQRAAALMAGMLPDDLRPDVVLSPAIGGIVWGYALAAAIGVRAVFAERDAQQQFTLRRGLSIQSGERVLMAEDVITTGRSVLELSPIVEQAGARIVGYAAVADRSAGRFQPNVPVFALTQLEFEVFEPGSCPLCAKGPPPVKPGSRAAVGTR